MKSPGDAGAIPATTFHTKEAFGESRQLVLYFLLLEEAALGESNASSDNQIMLSLEDRGWEKGFFMSS